MKLSEQTFGSYHLKQIDVCELSALQKNEKRHTCRGERRAPPLHLIHHWLVSHKMQIVPFSKWECSLMSAARCHAAERREALEEAAVLKSLRNKRLLQMFRPLAEIWGEKKK